MDDNPTNRLLLETILSHYGKCQIAVNGKEAVNAFRKAADTGLCYDLVCMDILMPEMDGFTAARQIRALEEVRGVQSGALAKITMTTASGETNDVLRSVRESCDGYVVKPVSAAQLLDRLKLLELLA